MYKVVAEISRRVARPLWRDESCARAYCHGLQQMWKNEYFTVKSQRMINNTVNKENLYDQETDQRTQTQ
jgi:hypothetical protein